MKFYDGRILGVDRSGDHWTFARNILDRVTPSAAKDPDVRLWYGATLRWLLGAMQLHRPHFQHAQRLYPDDPELLFLRGCLHETLASPRLQNIAGAVTSLAGPNRSIRSARAELEEAETFLRRALNGDPRSSEARLRLGRVQILLGKHAQAARELRQLLTSASNPVLLYYANLFLGRALESLGSRGEAQAAYERAAGYYPEAEAPRLALSQLAVGSGNHAGALAILESTLSSRDGTDDDDPWWRYDVNAGREAEMHLTAAYDALLGRTTP